MTAKKALQNVMSKKTLRSLTGILLAAVLAALMMSGAAAQSPAPVSGEDDRPWRQADRQVYTVRDLQDAIDAAPRTEPGKMEAWRIEIMADIGLEGELFIAEGQDIAICSAEPYTIKAVPGVRMFNVSGVFTLEDHVLLAGAEGDQTEGSGKGVYVDEGGVFIMNGGKISGHESADDGAGVYVCGGFTMNGGEISGNRAHYGGGVYTYGPFVMNGGRIINNTGGNGAGVYLFQASSVVFGGEISGNRSWSDGGGVYVSEYSIFMMDGGIISGNGADYYGGGVCVRGRFFMDGGELKDNRITADDSTDAGADVYIGYGGVFTKNGGSIPHGGLTQFRSRIEAERL